MPAGGTRQGTPGAQYPNRSDMQGGDRAYGDGVSKETIRAATPQTRPAPRPGPVPPAGSLGPLVAPTDRPHEPVTTGLRLGAGAGPEAMGNVPMIGPANQELNDLRALYLRFPYESIRRLLERAEAEA